jgi:hypothetical protein
VFHFDTTTEVLLPHPNAQLTVHGRRLLVDRVRDGRPVAHVADEMGISRTMAHKWVRRWRAEGDAGLYDRLPPARSSGVTSDHAPANWSTSTSPTNAPGPIARRRMAGWSV